MILLWFVANLLTIILIIYCEDCVLCVSLLPTQSFLLRDELGSYLLSNYNFYYSYCFY